MAQEYLANEDYTLEITSGGAWTPGGVGDHSYTEFKTAEISLSGKKAMESQISWIAGGCSWPGSGNTWKSGGGAINAASVKCFYRSAPLLKENDTGVCVGIFEGPGGPPPPQIACICTFKIKSAGQIKVKGK